MLNNATVADKKIAITGAGGFLGSHLLPLLKERKASPKCLVRSQSPELDGVEIIKGDCLDYQSIKHLLEGQDIFIHLAAMLFGSDWQEYLKTNTAIVRNINSALKELPPESRPKKIILVSSLSAAGPCGIAPGKKEDEAPTPVSAYGWSKLYCEEALAQAPVETYTILRPPIIYGSGDRGLLPLFRSLNKGIGASPGAFRKFPVSIIHAKDAAAAIVMACERNIPGIFHLSDGKIYNMDSFCHAAVSAMGKTTCIVMHTPLPIMAISARFSDVWHRLRVKFARAGGKASPHAPHWNYDKYLEAAQPGWIADSSLFEKVAGFVPQMDLASGMTETVNGYRARGWL